MIVLDADVLLIDMRYQRDPRFGVNRQALDRLKQTTAPVAITCHTLLEILGVCTFNLSPPDLLALAGHIPTRYGVLVLPDLHSNPAYTGGNYDDLENLIAKRLSLGDAVTAWQLGAFIVAATLFLSWNARHFVSKLPIPTLTPEQWLQQNPPSHQPPSPAKP